MSAVTIVLLLALIWLLANAALVLVLRHNAHARTRLPGRASDTDAAPAAVPAAAPEPGPAPVPFGGAAVGP